MKTIYVVLTNYCPKGYFGVYSDLLQARHAIELMKKNTHVFKSVEDCGDYRYILTTYDDENYWAEIVIDVIDTY